MTRSPRRLAQVIGALFAAEGVVGILSAQSFRALVIWLQTPPIWPFSVAIRALIGISLILIAQPARSASAVRAVGVVTLVGAAAGLLFTAPHQIPPGFYWRVGAVTLLLAGAAVLWGAATPRRA